MRLTGTETISVELAGTLDEDVAAPLPIERDAAGRAKVSVLVLEMRGLGLAVPSPRFDYREVLYRLGVIVDGAPAWLAVRCDIDRAIVSAMAKAIIRYPVRRAAIAIEPEGDEVSLRATTEGDELAAKLRLRADTPDAVPPRRTFVREGSRVLEVPWDERPAPVRRLAELVDVTPTRAFGVLAKLDAEAVVHRGRTHICGPARRIGL